MPAEIPKPEQVALFEEGYPRMRPVIFGYFYRRLGNSAIAEDLTAEVFTNAWRSLSEFGKRGLKFDAWIQRTARNEFLDYLRSPDKKRFFDPLDNIEETIPAQQAPVEQAVVDRVALNEAISRLPETYREVITNRFLLGLNVAQTSQAIGQPEGNVRTIQHRSLRLLREELAPNPMK